MPMRSQAQNRAMRAAAAGKSNIGIPKKVAKKFVAESHGQKVGKLPQRVKEMAEGGSVLKTQPERYHRRLDEFEAKGQKARAIAEKAREMGKRPPLQPSEGAKLKEPKGYAHGGSVKPSCKW